MATALLVVRTQLLQVLFGGFPAAGVRFLGVPCQIVDGLRAFIVIGCETGDLIMAAEKLFLNVLDRYRRACPSRLGIGQFQVG